MRLAVCVTTPEVPIVHPLAFFSGPFKEKIERIAAAGAAGVELMTIDPAALDVYEIRRHVEASGLEVSAVSSGAMSTGLGLTLLAERTEVRAAARLRFHDLLRFASEVGAPVVTVGSFRGKAAWAGGIEKASRVFQETIMEAATIAERLDVTIAIEPINGMDIDFITTYEEGVEFAQRIGRKNVGLLLDTYHVGLEKADSITSFQRAALSGILKHVHIADSDRLPPGEGSLDFVAIYDALLNGGYRGWLSAELKPGSDPGSTISSIKKMLLRFEEERAAS